MRLSRKHMPTPSSDSRTLTALLTDDMLFSGHDLFTDSLVGILDHNLPSHDSLQAKRNRLAELKDEIARMEEASRQMQSLFNDSMNSDIDFLESELGDSDLVSEFLEQPPWLTTFNDLLPEKPTMLDPSEFEERPEDDSASPLSLHEEAGEETDPKGKGKEKEPPRGKKRPFSDLGYENFHPSVLRTPCWPLSYDYPLAHKRSLHERSFKRYFIGDPSGSWQVRGGDDTESGFETHIEV